MSSNNGHGADGTAPSRTLSSDSDIAISARDLSKSYVIAHNEARHTRITEAIMDRLRRPFTRPQTETFWALKEVNFDIARGEVVGVIGRNGAGKSTLLKVLSRITEPTAGEIRLKGRVGSLLEVGTGFHPELTGRENVYLNGAILGMTHREIDRQFDAIVDFAGTERFLDTPVKRYSSGMYVRLAFAVAAHLSTEILIVDEVLAVGDAEFQEKCLGKMRDVSKEGRTILFVSHNMAAVQQLCSRALFMKKGQVWDDGPPSSVISNYLGDAKSSVNGEYDLLQHNARSPKHKAVITHVTLRNADGTPTSQFYSGESIMADLRMADDAFIEEPRVALAVEDAFGARMGTVASFFETEPMERIKGSRVVRCIIPQVNFAPGRYLVSVSVADGHRNMLDSVDGAGWFDVNWNNNYANNEPYSPVYGSLLLTSRWRMLPAEDVSDSSPTLLQKAAKD